MLPSIVVLQNDEQTSIFNGVDTKLKLWKRRISFLYIFNYTLDLRVEKRLHRE